MILNLEKLLLKEDMNGEDAIFSKKQYQILKVMISNRKVKNEEVRYYQPRFKRWIDSTKWDSIAERLSDENVSIITQVMNAEKDGDCSWLIWKCCDHVLDNIRTIAKKIDRLT